MKQKQQQQQLLPSGALSNESMPLSMSLLVQALHAFCLFSLRYTLETID